ncbi:MAG: hypothetical protein ABJV04_14115 [Aliiglaciecola sp.]|uniref:hypothetical protein n=1 Tax=Aliiglaciecola sp. TaxID=1872441 RepID=UPI0032995C76
MSANRIKLVLICLALILSCMFAFHSLKHLIASALIIKPQLDIEATKVELEKSTETEISTIIRRLNTSFKLGKKRSEIYFFLAQAYDLLDQKKQSIANDSSHLVIIQNYHKAILVQPSWELPWIYLAKYHFRRNETKDAIVYLQHALSIGRYENQVQKLSLPLVFEYWSHLDFESKDHAKNMLIHIFKFKRNQNFAFNLLKNYNDPTLLDFIEPLLTRKKHLIQFKKHKQAVLPPSLSE